MRQIPLAIGVEAARTLDNFVAGANALAIAHLRALSPQAAPVYLWGPSGAGKTHLLRSLVERGEAQGTHSGWFSAADPDIISRSRDAPSARARRTSSGASCHASINR